jgi:uncharacterized DUF497 family protein
VGTVTSSAMIETFERPRKIRRCRTLLLSMYTAMPYTSLAMKIDFDPAKDAVNIGAHGISLTASKELLEGFTVEWIDDRIDYGEIRIIAIGEINELEFVCVYTMRGELYRPISLRRANRKERNVYHQAKG